MRSLMTIPIFALRIPRSLFSFSVAMLPCLPSFFLPEERDDPGQVLSPVPDEHMVVQGGCRPLHPETEDLIPQFRLLMPQLLDREVLDLLLLLHGRLMPLSTGTS